MDKIPSKMSAVLLTAHGGLETLEYRQDIDVPTPANAEVLISVRGAGVNNTDINTRIGWYSKKVVAATNSGAEVGLGGIDEADASWCGVPMQFPRIQGADVCGIIVAVGKDVPKNRIGQRVLVRNMLRHYVDYRPYECWTLGSECDGGFAQFVVAPACETFAVNCDWSDAELASIPCAYSTAENSLHRANVGCETVLVTGASGGVGSAAVQLAKRRRCTVIAICGKNKFADVKQLGADKLIDRNADLVAELGKNSVDVVIDLVAGSNWSQLLDVLKVGGRYSTAGAIAGPMVELDVRTLYLKDLTLYGCTFQADCVFENLITYIENGDIRPVVAKTYNLADIRQAQTDFLSKKHTGKLVLLPAKL